MNGTSMRDLMELGGWSEYRMVLRYSHLDSTHLARVVDTFRRQLCNKIPIGMIDRCNPNGVRLFRINAVTKQLKRVSAKYDVAAAYPRCR